MIKACIFDLDGVIVDTAKYHFTAWRRLANSLGFDFTEVQNEELKGVNRVKSLEMILEWGGVQKTDEEKKRLAATKNDWYVESIASMDENEILPGIKTFLDELQDKSIKIGLGSASKNAIPILTAINLLPYFEAISDGNSTKKSKPDPEVFHIAADLLKTEPKNCTVFEDSIMGIRAANAGGFHSIGVGDSNVLNEAQVVIQSFEGYDIQTMTESLVTLKSKS